MFANHYEIQNFFPDKHENEYHQAVAIVRILIDGYSLLHSWLEIAPGKPRFSAAARDDLIYWLTQYQDVIGTPITIIFDGQGAPLGTPKIPSRPELEILYSKAGQTADQMIERVAHRMKSFGEVLVVTDDYAEQDTVTAVGGLASSCFNFINSVQLTMLDLQGDIKNHNTREVRKFRKLK